MTLCYLLFLKGFVDAIGLVWNGMDRGWVPLVEMDAGDVLENFIFGNLLVYRVYHDVGRGCVYNFEVDDFHSYYVGEQGVWVHNKCEVQVTKVRDLEGLTEKKEIYRKGDYLNLAEKDSTANTARIGEDAGDIALYKSTGRDFRTDMRNKSDNGPDYWCLDDSSLSSGGRATLTVADAKGSLRGRYPGVENLKLNQKTLSWMYEGSGEAFKPGGDSSPFKGYKQSGKGGAYEDGQGRINDQVLDESVQKEFRRAYDLWKGDPEGQVLFSIILSCSNARSSVSSCAAPRFWRKAKPAKALGALGGLCV